jgi:hypothetical protein
VEAKTEIQSSFHITKNALDEVEVWLPWSMHVQARLLNGMSNVWPRQSQVLKSAGKAAILSGICNKRTIIGG